MLSAREMLFLCQQSWRIAVLITTWNIFCLSETKCAAVSSTAPVSLVNLMEWMFVWNQMLGRVVWWRNFHWVCSKVNGTDINTGCLGENARSCFTLSRLRNQVSKSVSDIKTEYTQNSSVLSITPMQIAFSSCLQLCTAVNLLIQRRQLVWRRQRETKGKEKERRCRQRVCPEQTGR